MTIFNEQIASDEVNEMTLTCLSTEASTLTNGNGDTWPEALGTWQYKVH